MVHRDLGVYAISVAADLLSMQVQNLRVYERHGLVEPDRTAGGTRLYSQDDLDRLARIRDLLADGLNMAGITRVLALEAEVERLEARVAVLRRGNDYLHPDRPSVQPGRSIRRSTPRSPYSRTSPAIRSLRSSRATTAATCSVVPELQQRDARREPGGRSIAARHSSDDGHAVVTPVDRQQRVFREPTGLGCGTHGGSAMIMAKRSSGVEDLADQSLAHADPGRPGPPARRCEACSRRRPG